MNQATKSIGTLSVIGISIALYGFGTDQLNIGVKQEYVSPLSTTTPAPTASPSATPAPTATPTPAGVWTGKASWYGRNGCLGCSETMTMANGQPLDDSAMTVAFNMAPLGTQLSITNTATDQTATATVTDTGGFHRHGKIIDLVPAVKEAIGCGSTCDVKVREL